VEKAAKHAPLAQWVQQWQRELAQALVESGDDDQGDELITLREGASVVNAPYTTVHRWAKQHAASLGVEKFGGRIYLSRRRLKFLANRRFTKF
jgi:hypothetical protein